MTAAADQLRQQGSAARAASALLARTPAAARNHALHNLARALETEQPPSWTPTPPTTATPRPPASTTPSWTACS